MLTLPQIIQRVNERRHQSAKYVRILAVKKGWDSLGRGYVASASYSTKVWDPYKRKFVKNERGPGGKPMRYVTVIVFLDPRLHVVVSCSCADFKYRWEVALNHKQAAEIEYSNGELPVIRNPTMRTAQCKHLVALYNKIKDQLPKRRANDNTPAINPPKVQTPPSVLKKLAEEEAKKALKIKKPTNVQRSAKPGKKQSTLPRSMQQPKAPPPPPPKPTPAAKPGKKTSGPAMMKAPAKPGKRAQPSSGPAMMKAPGSKSKPAAKPAAPAAKPKSGPAMMAPKAKPASAPVSRGPAMMRSRK